MCSIKIQIENSCENTDAAPCCLSATPRPFGPRRGCIIIQTDLHVCGVVSSSSHCCLNIVTNIVLHNEEMSRLDPVEAVRLTDIAMCGLTCSEEVEIDPLLFQSKSANASLHIRSQTVTCPGLYK